MSDTEALVAFDKARLDEDAAAAKACADSGGSVSWRDSLVQASGDHAIRTAGNRPVARIRLADSEARDGHTLNPDACAVHIARHDPGRVLREVAAKRAVIEVYEAAAASDDPKVDYSIGMATMRMVLRSYATVWSGHPDYRPEWKP